MRKLLNHLVSSSGIRDMGRALGCHPSVIQHRIRTLARRIMSVCYQETSLLELKEDVAADGLENFILSQFFPTNLNILVGHESQFIYHFNSYHFKRKGEMTEKQREKKKTLYEEALFEKGAASSRFREILDYLEKKARESSRESFVLNTDEHPIYDTQFKRHKTIAEKVIHRKTSSQKERNCQNKLFPCNYIDRQIRKDLAEYIRETVQFGRNMNNSMDRFTCYSFWHNYMKPFRINRGKSSSVRHAQAAGFSLKEIGVIVSEVFKGVGRSKEASWGYLTDFQKRHWERNLVNPLCRCAV
jgi:hypothetical protein